MILRNATKDPKQLNAKTSKFGIISITFQGGEEKEVPNETVKKLKENPACLHWFRTKVIVEVKAPKGSVKEAEVEVTKTEVDNPKKSKGKGKGKGKSDLDTELGL